MKARSPPLTCSFYVQIRFLFLGTTRHVHERANEPGILSCQGAIPVSAISASHSPGPNSILGIGCSARGPGDSRSDPYPRAPALPTLFSLVLSWAPALLSEIAKDSKGACSLDIDLFPTTRCVAPTPRLDRHHSSFDGRCVALSEIILGTPGGVRDGPRIVD